MQQRRRAQSADNRKGLDKDPVWYKSGVIYEVHVRAFYDTDADGTGDFRGLSEKLDYIKDLGVTAIWLLPFYPSPLKDDGYDIADYRAVHPKYGTLGDFKYFLKEAHRRGLRVITELVLNHTSDQHPWFQRARRAKPGSRWRNFYVWSENAAQYSDARIIFKDVEISNWTWDHVAGAYFWHRFFSHQPDLNYDNPEVHQEMIDIVDFWFEMGVDGLRLDAVPYLYEREGTSCENLPETHVFLKKLRAHIDQKYEDRMLLGEANQWPEDAVSYFGQGMGDECHMAYHFPLMPRLFMSVRMEDRQPIVDILEQTPPIPETSQWALFLRNHDELTLEMVTDEERDYMYRMYAHVTQARLNLGIRRRLAPLLNNDRKSIELLNALLFSLPGTPVLYYGDEIGLGENIFLGDRNGVRTPMQWSSDKNAGFSRANPQSLYLPIILDPSYHYEANNVEVQLGNPHSLLWWMRRLLALRKRWKALGEGKCEFLQSENRKILSYILRYQQETLLVVANLSRFPQPVELDLSAFQGLTPIELFGRTEFPAVDQRPYFLSMGPHSFYWFSLEPKLARSQAQSTTTAAPVLTINYPWQEILLEKNRLQIRGILPDYLRRQTWFSGKSKVIKLLTVRETVPVRLSDGSEALVAFLQIEYVDSDMEFYTLPLAFAIGTQAETVRQTAPACIIAELNMGTPEQSGVLYDGLGNGEFCGALLELISSPRRLRTSHGEIEGVRLPGLRQMLGGAALPKAGQMRNNRSNSCVGFEDKMMLKFFRRIEPGINPEFEIGKFLTAHGFEHSQTLAGAIEYRGQTNSRTTLAVLHAFTASTTTAWDYTLDSTSRYYDRATTWVAQEEAPTLASAEPLKLLQPDIPEKAAEIIGTYLESARLLGLRTAELHCALASDPGNPDFAPEPATPYYRRAVFQSMRNGALQNLRALRKQLKSLPAELQPMAQQVADLEPVIVQIFRGLSDRPVSARRLRLHGECRLDHVLWTGKDFVFIDFEGDSSAPIGQRNIKHSPLRDVAALVRSFHYAAYVGLEQHVERGSVLRDNLPKFQSWMRYWNRWVSAAFLKAYFQNIASAQVLPGNEEDLRVMLRAHVLERMIGELGTHLQEKDKWLEVPLQGILFVAGETAASASAPAPAEKT
ncbi:MAG TPA: maltose alpha-D-glucosyltransferase [Verrucomicrobiae bacterium]|nr:maltose alpha-D-glucosyltransferase [Verrucomicrobiae bacterium]